MSPSNVLDIPDIDLQGVSFAYPNSTNDVLDHVDWHVDEGEFVVLAGPSGSGKSTLLRTLNGLVPHFSGGRFGGSALIRGNDTRIYGPRVLSRSVGFVFQEPEAQSVAAIVEDELAFGMEQLGVPPLTMRKRVEEVLDLLGISDLRHRELATLSGGERQRVAVAAALTLQPRVLVLDEPTSQLDPWGAEDVFSALARLNDDLGLTVVVSEHRLERVLTYADRLRLLQGGETFDGAPADILQLADSGLLPPLARLGRHLGWSPLPLSIKEGRAARRFDPRLPSPPPTDLPKPSGPPIARLSRVTVKHGATSILRNIDFDVRPGELVALMGRNGSGKTTLLRAMMGFHSADSGKVELVGRDVAKSHPSQIAKQVGYLPQRPVSLLFNPTVKAEIDYTIANKPGGPTTTEMLMDRLDLTRLASRYPLDLSVGEQERTALAAVLAGDPAILLLDEPTRGMDAARKRMLADQLRQERERGTAIVMATHDVELVAECATRVVLLGDGEIVVDGSPRDVLSGSMTFATQVNKLYGNGFLTVDDITSGLGIDPLHDRAST